jgi:pyrroline-5-carboxylate reductase
MAEAIIKGLITSSVVKAEEISVGEPIAQRRNLLEGRHMVHTTADNLKVAQSADVIVLSVKPQQLSQVMTELKGELHPRQTVLSIVAGTRLEKLVQGLQHEVVIRVMPNTPAQIGAGMSVWTCTPQVPQGPRQFAQSMLRTIGEEMYVEDEHYLEMATALSASGPAYIFLVIEALIDAGVYLGLPRDMARAMVLQTVLGSVRLVKEAGQHPAQLKDMVTSPAGTTVEGLLVLEDERVRSALIRAVLAAYEKALDLGERK